MLEEVRGPLLEEARRSPSLLSDLAGLERYVAESYDARSFVELLQNADDAGGTRFAVRRAGDFLLVANDGRPFTQTDFEGLCRSAASSKQHGTSIGYRGIGFKSVVGFAETVYVFSGALEASFSRERTAEEVPEASRVPLVRIPHPVEAEDRAQLAGVLDEMAGQGYRTVFAFKDLIATGIEAEFAAFDSTSMLFLRNTRQVEFRAAVAEVITAQCETIDERTRTMFLVSSSGTTSWRVVERNGVALAFATKEGTVERLEEREATVHAFLPTHEPTGLAVKMNGDISTDPSRTRVILDERTAAGIEDAARLVVELVLDALDGGDRANAGKGVIAALVPFQDPRMAAFQKKSFKAELLSAIRRLASDRLEDLRYRPAWLNAADFEHLAAVSQLRFVPRDLESVEGLPAFLRFMGAREATLEDLKPGLKAVTPSLVGAAEVVSHVAKLHATKQLDVGQVDEDWRLWPVDGKQVTLDEARRAAKPLYQGFADMVSERVGVGGELRRLVASLSDSATASRMVPDEVTSRVQPRPPALADEGPQAAGAAPKEPRRLSLKKWRGAEQQVLSLLELQGWSVKDVSRQNVGYDIEGVTPEGEKALIEVKAIEHPGQPFTITSNEEATARQEGDAYRLAIVRQAGAKLEVAFVRDPANRLELTRQCRQWVWECSSYDYDPETFLLE